RFEPPAEADEFARLWQRQCRQLLRTSPLRRWLVEATASWWRFLRHARAMWLRRKMPSPRLSPRHWWAGRETAVRRIRRLGCSLLLVVRRSMRYAVSREWRSGRLFQGWKTFRTAGSH